MNVLWAAILSLTFVPLVISAPRQCSCGKSRDLGSRNAWSARIVGGTESPSGKHPWMVGLLDALGFNFCGGVLVSRYHILTAAHCVSNKQSRDLRAVVGESDVDMAFLFNRHHSIKDITVHPSFIHSQWSHDIAVVTLRDPVDSEPICLPEARTRDYGNLMVTGWGRTATRNMLKPSRLRQVALPQIDDQRCERAWAENQVSRAGQMCAGAPGRDTCVYDSGSPLMDMTTGQTTLAGVTSFGSSQCGEATKPGVYTRVASYLEFIEQNTWGTCTRS
ncbi:Chymotrypsinogen A [Halotydeus destructor]|nr:Chymotrypsinogen A [Halotydeus destructor]